MPLPLSVPQLEVNDTAHSVAATNHQTGLIPLMLDATVLFYQGQRARIATT